MNAFELAILQGETIKETLLKERIKGMKITKQKAYELFNMDKPDPYNETMTFLSIAMAHKAQKLYGGNIKISFVYKEEVKKDIPLHKQILQSLSNWRKAA